ncbi:GNAT family N-acetyltransferase [Longispora albida]|uniref:GNAT family N-acetyltransferase n=1 Tax=Longispora albida TaxID=203523 RepID=UPI000362212B|nr:GNAT family N-acetyltransferase [Longispora albida]
MSGQAVQQRLENRRNWRASAAETVVAAMTANGNPAGFLALSVREEHGETVARVDDIWVEPELRGQGLGTAARAWGEEWARAKGAVKISTTVDGRSHLFDDYPLRAMQMVKRLGDAPELPEGVTARPMTEEEFPAWRDGEVEGYARDISSSGLMSLERALERSRQEFPELLPEGMATPGHTFWVVEAGQEQVATIWLRHDMMPGMSYVFGVTSSPAHRGKGYGRAAMLAGERASVEAGDTVLGLNVFGSNAVAQNLYTKLGYVATERNRSRTL